MNNFLTHFYRCRHQRVSEAERVRLERRVPQPSWKSHLSVPWGIPGQSLWRSKFNLFSAKNIIFFPQNFYFSDARLELLFIICLEPCVHGNLCYWSVCVLVWNECIKTVNQLWTLWRTVTHKMCLLWLEN